ncbi:hypothetical protein FNV43_RR14140 [Rhamnella rubrinervis]|uniref:Uncharacterized protein n=1 Tax=Rhamnella rubrinervis TaxID=2594499 RepID=A0A8K0H2Q7_9ROSA|nr:hypothetical protein FNV43_RR14140 [Rhamnella rubrinervis]
MMSFSGILRRFVKTAASNPKPNELRRLLNTAASDSKTIPDRQPEAGSQSIRPRSQVIIGWLHEHFAARVLILVGVALPCGYLHAESFAKTELDSFKREFLEKLNQATPGF